MHKRTFHSCDSSTSPDTRAMEKHLESKQSQYKNTHCSYLHKIQPPFPKPIPSRFPAFNNLLLTFQHLFSFAKQKPELEPLLLKEKQPLESSCRPQLHGSSKIPSARAAKNTMACVKYRLMACSDMSLLQDIHIRHQTFQSALPSILIIPAITSGTEHWGEKTKARRGQDTGLESF